MSVDILTKLKSIPTFDGVPESQLNWLIERSTCKTYSVGDYLFKKGDPMDNMYIILQGQFIIKIEQKNQFRTVGTFDENTITGTLPYSRAVTATGYAEANRDGKVLCLEKKYFKEMINEHEELTTALVHFMSSRIREFTKLQQQNDKMMALGKLSAGLAHELNNPSAAVVRSARTLQKHLSLLPENFKKVIKIKATDEQVDVVNDILFSKVEKGVQELSLMEKADKEDQLAEWLEDHGAPDGYDLVDNFIDFNFSLEDFEKLASSLRPEDLLPVINWLNQVLTTEKLVTEIQDASQRINDLVASVKGYTHMDQAPEKKATDIHNGINNTLTMLQHKLRKGKIDVVKNYDTNLRQPQVFVSELNQVWTNLIDNAIDAMAHVDRRELQIETKNDGEFVNINIIDSGEGIPEEIMDQIFDPFFTTKAVGEGTGLGLDVVQQIINQHNGSIKINSKPGETTFKICLPIK